MHVLLGPLVLFAAVMSLTPGPNVVLVTASAANFGFGRTVELTRFRGHPSICGDADHAARGRGRRRASTTSTPDPSGHRSAISPVSPFARE